MLTRAREFHKKYERWTPIAFFLMGFLFDASVLKRVDEFKVIVQQALYLAISAALIGVELIEHFREVHPPRILSKFWKYREPLLHFLLGTLLNSFTIFYFKSASALTSFLYIAALVALLIINEFKRFGKSQTLVHFGFLSLCLISFLVELMPTLLGFMGVLPFLSAVAVSAAAFMAYYRLMEPRLKAHPGMLKSHLVYPFVATHLLFILLYFTHVIPPVPLSVKYMGIYHAVKKTDEGYELISTEPRWKFWEHGDQNFSARPGDAVYCYVQIFSPTGFKDRLQIRWLYWEPRRGWLPSDAIPISVSGGRDEGYRAVTKKANFQAGTWRVQIETMDNQEIGRIDFTVEPDESTGEREFRRSFRG